MTAKHHQRHVRKVVHARGPKGHHRKRPATKATFKHPAGPVLVTARSSHKPQPTRGAARGLLIHGDWITGYNDHAPTCVATAIANSLLAATGIRVTDDDVLLLFLQSGGHGVSMAASLAALAVHGIGGCFPASHENLATLQDLTDGDIVGLAGIHAACQTDAGLVSWGDTIGPEWEPDGEAWRIDWH